MNRVIPIGKLCTGCKDVIPIQRDPVLDREIPTPERCLKCRESQEQGWRDFMGESTPDRDPV